MNKPLAMALLVGGIVLLVLGYHASQSASSTVSRFLNGTPTTKSIVLMVCGVIGIIVGGLGLGRGK